MTSPVPAFRLDSATPAPVTPPPRRGGRVALLVVGALVLIAATAGGTWWLTRPAASSAPPTAVASPTGPSPLPIFGRLELDDVTLLAEPGDECWGHRGYDDIRGGAQVTITDSAGKVIGVGALDPGYVTYDSTGAAYTCKFEFVVTGVKAGGGFYGVEVAHRGRVQFSEAALAAAIKLSLG